MRSSCNLFESINGSTASIIWIFEVMQQSQHHWAWSQALTKELYSTPKTYVTCCTVQAHRLSKYVLVSLCSSTITFVNYLYKTKPTARDPNMQASGTNTNINWCTATNTVHRSQPTTSVPTCSHKGRYCRDSGGPLATPSGHILMTSTNIEIIGFIIIISFFWIS